MNSTVAHHWMPGWLSCSGWGDWRRRRGGDRRVPAETKGRAAMAPRTRLVRGEEKSIVLEVAVERIVS